MADERHLGLFGATTLGVGAIVGGGILALAGVAFATAGPAAILAFALNGGIAYLTAASFAELGRRFPESGGIYTYAKKVLSIEVAFVVGWVVWFASIVAGVLYALGFAAFAAEGLGRLLGPSEPGAGPPGGAGLRIGLATGAIAAYTLALVRRAAGGGAAASVGKVVVFAILVLSGVWAWIGASPAEMLDRLTPFATAGPTGVVQAMGYTFIALQGFDLIAAVGGEVREPERTLPRAMYLSLAIALVIYLPLLFLMATVGAPPVGGIASAAAANPEGLVAVAVERFMGPAGFWLVIGAGVLSMLSALHANLLGASRVGFTMARDRTLPRRLGQVSASTGTPAVSVVTTGATVAVVALVIGDVAAAGAASSLIFLISFAMVHWAAILARRRSGDRGAAHVPLAGATLCLGLAVFQAFAVREAGSIVALWLGIGAVLYLTLFASGARLADAAAQAVDPDLARLRGRSPLVLVPIANPASAAGLVDVAATLRTPGVGRILLLTVLEPPEGDDEGKGPTVREAQAVLGEALERSLERSLVIETLFTLASDPWREIARVAEGHRCETVLVGLPDLGERGEGRLDRLIEGLQSDVVVLRAPRRWQIAEAERVLVLIGGRRDHSHLRARLLASLGRSGDRSLVFRRTLPETASPEARRKAERALRALARDEAMGPYEAIVDYVEDRRAAMIERVQAAELVVMGLRPRGSGGRLMGELLTDVARETDTPMILISRRQARTLVP